MKVLLLALLVVALPCAAAAQVRENDLRIATGRRAYEACINSKVDTARAMRADHQWLQKLVEAECNTEADALHAVVVEWSREQEPRTAAAGQTIAALYVNKVKFNRVYGAGPAAFGSPAGSPPASTGRSSPGDDPARR